MFSLLPIRQHISPKSLRDYGKEEGIFETAFQQPTLFSVPKKFLSKVDETIR